MAKIAKIGTVRNPRVALPSVALPVVGLRGAAGSGGGGYWPAGTPEAIRQACMLWYDIARQGCTNETMAADPVLRDLSGNGHDAECFNFAWSGMSGIGGYDFALTEFFRMGSGDFLNDTRYECNTAEGNPFMLYTNGSTPHAAFKVKVSGLTQGIQYRYSPSADSETTATFNIPSDGEYEIPQSYANSNIPTVGFLGRQAGLVIELVPLYPNALVSDGVDDKAVVEGGLKVLVSYTVIAKRKIIDGYGCFLKKGYAGETAGEFLFEGNKANEDFGTQNYGYTTTIPLHGEDISWQTSESYNGIPLEKGTSSGFYNFYMFGLNKYTRTALYSAALFDRDLTTEEIEWVKTNMMQQ